MSVLKMDGYDDCVLGLCSQFGRPDVLAYDLDKVIAKLMDEGMTEEEAYEFWSYNQVAAWVGDHTPVFVKVGNIEDFDFNT